MSESMNGTARKALPVAGLFGLALAVVGVVLVVIQAPFWMTTAVLIVAFGASVLGLFQKDTAKWPAIVGAIVSAVTVTGVLLADLVLAMFAILGPTGGV